MYSSLSLCHRDTLHPMNPTLMLSGGKGGGQGERARERGWGEGGMKARSRTNTRPKSKNTHEQRRPNLHHSKHTLSCETGTGMLHTRQSEVNTHWLYS